MFDNWRDLFYGSTMSTEPVRVNRISQKARPNTAVRKSLPDALRDELTDAAVVETLVREGARVSFVGDASFTENGLHALRHREFPAGGPTRGVPMSGETIAELVKIGRGGWAEAARIFLSVFVASYGTDLEVVRVFSLTFLAA
jgi:hypothetical protein